jgi:hypothetical protein
MGEPRPETLSGLQPVKHDPREVREGLKGLLADNSPASTPGARKVIRDAIETIATMQADLRRQGLTEYDEGETP